MRAFVIIFIAAFSPLILPPTKSAELPSPSANERIFPAKGVIRGINLADKNLTIEHGAISNFMAAMTMPFNVKNTNELKGLSVNDEISFQLHVTPTDSWIDRIVKTGTVAANENPMPVQPSPENPLWACQFTNELGQAVSLNDFRGQALAVTFIYTRCPLPNACPRLSKNFQEASEKLAAMTNLPANWHFLSITFDPEHDTPTTLKNYGELYNYNPAHWSFLTGSPDKIAELAQLADLRYEPDSGFINHDFRTLIVDASGRLQTIFPVSGDLSDSIVAEMIKAVSATNQTALLP
ncbi:MAG TPA: SCO family protein [Verrucomicrobiae bacterium]|nr:SCO family protein [Verrucomicrobiae bacterium]